ncbi:GIN domain-containing protein [Wenyingzhuangia sp. IMCC45574]
MKKIFFALLLVTTAVFSQDLERNLKEFKSVTISSAMDVELIKADVFKIEAVGQDVSKLNVENKSQELSLSTSLTKKFKSDIKVKIFYKPGIRYIKLSNNVILHSKSILTENLLELIAINNVKVDLRLKIKDFVGRFELGSNISLKGTTESQKLKVLTKSEYNGFDFKSKKTYIKAVTSKADIYVSEYLEANSRVKAKINYKGDPFSVNEKSFMGDIIRVD